MGLEIAIPALRDDELIKLYGEIYDSDDKRIAVIEAQFKIRQINKDDVIDKIIRKNEEDNQFNQPNNID
jgi:hypothetical protein